MGKYCMYLSVNGQVWNSSFVLCTADNIDGPYTYQGTIVYSGFTNGAVNNVNDTDVPRVLGHHPDISRYLSNGSWFGGIYMLELDEKSGLRDVVMMQRYLLSTAALTDPAAGDLDGGGTLDIFDLARMKRALLA